MDNKYNSQTYTFFIQSVEDFHAQLCESKKLDLDLNRCTLAKTMLKNIGVKAK